MKYQPRIDFNNPPETLDIKVPCESCAHWNPQRDFYHTGTGYKFNGVRLCHTNEMTNDFSCYKEKTK